MTHLDVVTIARRFCGPPGSGNGGYVAGVLARRLQPAQGPEADANTADTGLDAIEVTLRSPPLLEQPMQIAVADEGDAGPIARLCHGATLVAEARPVALTLRLPPPPTWVEAERMSRSYVGFSQHAFPGCFVCGPQRAEGDGLRIFPGRESSAEPAGPVMAPLVFTAAMGCDGSVPPEFLWASLDCPGYFGVAELAEPALLGRITAVVHRPVQVGEPLIVVGFGLGRAGRKLHAGSALFDMGGRPVARSRQVWLNVAQVDRPSGSR